MQLQELREFGEFLGLQHVNPKTACLITAIVQAVALGVLATSSWLLPWLIPSASIGFVLVVGMVRLGLTAAEQA